MVVERTFRVPPQVFRTRSLVVWPPEEIVNVNHAPPVPDTNEILAKLRYYLTT